MLVFGTQGACGHSSPRRPLQFARASFCRLITIQCLAARSRAALIEISDSLNRRGEPVSVQLSWKLAYRRSLERIGSPARLVFGPTALSAVELRGRRLGIFACCFINFARNWVRPRVPARAAVVLSFGSPASRRFRLKMKQIHDRLLIAFDALFPGALY